jgi:hypothetical protein
MERTKWNKPVRVAAYSGLDEEFKRVVEGLVPHHRRAKH